MAVLPTGAFAGAASAAAGSLDTINELNNAVTNFNPLPFRSQGTAPGNDLGQNKYNFDYTVFPRDIGMDYMGHYCIININVPTQGVKLPGQGLQVGAAAGNYGAYFETLQQVSKLDTLRYGNYNIPGAPPGTPRGATLSIPRNTRRIAESIALFMPTPLTFNQHNQYEEVSLSALGGKAIGIAAQFFSGALGPAISASLTAAFGAVLGGINSGVGGLAGGAAAGILSQPGGYDVLATASKLAQNPINPAIEVIFANTIQRQFVMEWLLAPRNEDESFAVRKIIQTLRFHGSPEINPNFGGFFWIPPADFDITFFHRGRENTNVLRINTCVLERCEVQYDPTGTYATFRNGHPVAVRLSLAFRELEPIHKLRVLQGF